MDTNKCKVPCCLGVVGVIRANTRAEFSEFCASHRERATSWLAGHPGSSPADAVLFQVLTNSPARVPAPTPEPNPAQMPLPSVAPAVHAREVLRYALACVEAVERLGGLAAVEKETT